MGYNLTAAQQTYLNHVSRGRTPQKLRNRMMQMLWHFSTLIFIIILGLHAFQPTLIPNWLRNLTNFYVGMLVALEFLALCLLGICFVLVLFEAPPKEGFQHIDLPVRAKLRKYHETLIALAPIFTSKSLWGIVNRTITYILFPAMIIVMACDGWPILATLYILFWTSAHLFYTFTRSAIYQTISWIKDDQIPLIMEDNPINLDMPPAQLS